MTASARDEPVADLTVARLDRAFSGVARRGDRNRNAALGARALGRNHNLFFPSSIGRPSLQHVSATFRARGNLPARRPPPSIRRPSKKSIGFTPANQTRLTSPFDAVDGSPIGT